MNTNKTVMPVQNLRLPRVNSDRKIDPMPNLSRYAKSDVFATTAIDCFRKTIKRSTLFVMYGHVATGSACSSSPT